MEPSLAGLLAEAEHLTDYAVVFRYLDAPHEPDTAEATAALEIAGGYLSAFVLWFKGPSNRI